MKWEVGLFNFPTKLSPFDFYTHFCEINALYVNVDKK